MVTARISVSENRPVESIELEKLFLDDENPRFGGQGGARTQKTILDSIVETYGVDDLLSSLSMNGYFKSEPLVGFRTSKGVTIAEGNRRLAACLVLEADPRAANQAQRRQKYDRVGRTSVTSLPVLVYDTKKELLPFMGVRHIAAQNPWDSYAKAHWVAEMLRTKQFQLRDITDMIGDQFNTISRMLGGYYFVNQLVAERAWEPESSERPGRGSNPNYPFSWVYTAIGFKSLQDYLELKDERVEAPIPKERVKAAAEFLHLMFGDKPRKRRAAIDDSRQIVDLAGAVLDPKQLGILRDGRPLTEALLEGKEPVDRVEDGLYASFRRLAGVSEVLNSRKLTQAEAKRVSQIADELRRMATKVYKEISSAAADVEEEDSDS
jgi:hypothetical protein